MHAPICTTNSLPTCKADSDAEAQTQDSNQYSCQYSGNLHNDLLKYPDGKDSLFYYLCRVFLKFSIL